MQQIKVGQHKNLSEELSATKLFQVQAFHFINKFIDYKKFKLILQHFNHFWTPEIKKKCEKCENVGYKTVFAWGLKFPCH